MIVYSSNTCAPCGSLKKYLDHKGVEYRVLDIDENTVHAETVLRLTGRLTVPVTVVEGFAPVIGLNYGAISKIITEAQLV